MFCAASRAAYAHLRASRVFSALRAYLPARHAFLFARTRLCALRSFSLQRLGCVPAAFSCARVPSVHLRAPPHHRPSCCVSRVCADIAHSRCASIDGAFARVSSSSAFACVLISLCCVSVGFARWYLAFAGLPPLLADDLVRTVACAVRVGGRWMDIDLFTPHAAYKR